MNVPKIFRTIAAAAIMVAVAVGCDAPKDTTLRVLYWNFQNDASEAENFFQLCQSVGSLYLCVITK